MTRIFVAYLPTARGSGSRLSSIRRPIRERRHRRVEHGLIFCRERKHGCRSEGVRKGKSALGMGRCEARARSEQGVAGSGLGQILKIAREVQRMQRPTACCPHAFNSYMCSGATYDEYHPFRKTSGRSQQLLRELEIQL